MLAVVDHEEHIAVGQPVGERILVRLSTRPRQPELRRYFGGDEVRGPERAEPPPGKSREQAAATVIASAVLPTPPGPSSVVTGAEVTLSLTSRISLSLPTSRRGRNTVGLEFAHARTRWQ